MGGRHRPDVRALTCVVAVAMVLVVAACTGSSAPASTTTATSSQVGPSLVSSSQPSAQASSTSEATASATNSVLVVYRGYWSARVRAHAAPGKPIPNDLATYAIDKAETDTESTILRLRQQGIEFRGEPVVSPTVTAIKLGDHASASISDCVDSTNWKPVFAASGKSALAPGQPMRVIVESTARIYTGRWVIDLSVAYRDRTC